MYFMREVPLSGIRVQHGGYTSHVAILKKLILLKLILFTVTLLLLLKGALIS